MPRLVHRMLVLVGFALALTTGRATAQDNFDANKTPAQLFANDCSGCHKSPTGLAKAPGLFGLESYLREHYTASRQAAAAIAGYLRAADAEEAARTPVKRRKSEPRQRAEKPAKKREAKPVDDKASGESKTEKKSEPKSDDAKSESKSESKSEAKSETKPETKPESKSEAKSEQKPEPKAEAKSDVKPETKPADKPGEARAESKSAGSPDKSEKKD